MGLRAVAWWALLVLGLGAVGCGPSYESIYEGNVRFEHCHRLDRDPDVSSSHREYCWNEWVQLYTYGQTRDRLDYAMRRLRVLRGQPPPGTRARGKIPEAAGAAAEPGEVVETKVSESKAVAPADGTLPTAQNKPELPEEQCAEACLTTLLACKDNCQTAPRGCTPCEPEYRSCMRRCFE